MKIEYIYHIERFLTERKSMILKGEVRESHTIVTVVFNVYKITGGIFSFKNQSYFDCASEYINFPCVQRSSGIPVACLALNWAAGLRA